MISIPKLNKSILPYPPQKNYKKLLGKWLKKNPWVMIRDGVMFPLETKVLGTKTHIKVGTIINGPMVIKGSGSVTIGKYCGIAENLYIISSNHKIDYADIGGMFSENVDTNKGQIYIGNNVWIGDNVTILSGVAIGDGAVIGAGSVVTHNVPAFTVVAGVPAKIIKQRFTRKTAEKLQDISWWHWDYKTILKNKSFFNTKIDDKNIDKLEENLDLKGEKEIASLDFNSKDVNNYLLNGWWEKESNLCWTNNKEAIFFFKIKDNNKYKNLICLGNSFHLPQRVSVIVNRIKIGSFLMKTEMSGCKVKVKNLRKGINSIKLIFEHGFSPSSVSQSQDKRILYCCFSSFKLL